jgi:hypothetical protein
MEDTARDAPASDAILRAHEPPHPRRQGKHGQEEAHRANAAEDEDLRTTLLSARRLMNRVKRGAINDLKTITAAYWLNANRARLRAARFGGQARLRR